MAPALPAPRLARSLFAALLAAALTACGGTLYDAAGVPAVTEGPPCLAPNRICGGNCVEQSPAACGAGCEVCAGPAGADLTCEPGTGGAYACGYTCPAGQLACPAGCCQATAVAAGEAHACAVTNDTALVCWGSNDRGQLGPAAAAAVAPSPVQVFASGVTAVAAGAHHTCAVRAGAVTCWGANDGGQLGTGATGSGGANPVAVGLTGASALALGTAHSCALTSGGTVRCWGANAQGQQGAGDTAAQPTRKSTPVASGATLLSAGGDTTCAVTGDAPICWGADARGQAGAGGATRSPRATPGPVAGLPAAAPVSLSVGGLHACAALGDGTGLWCWGANDLGQLGTGAAGVDEPAAIQASKLDNNLHSVLSLAGGGHTCTAKSEFPDPSVTLKCGGRNDLQQAGVALPSPMLGGNDVSVVVSLLAVDGKPPPPGTAAAAGGDFTCVLVGPAGAASVKCWGGNGSGQLGRGTAGGSQGGADYVSGKR